MSAVWMRARAEVRSSWRATIGLALVIGITGAVVMTAAAGARRTERAYPEFRRAQNTAQLGIARDDFYEDPPASPGDLAAAADARDLDVTILSLLGAVILGTMVHGIATVVRTHRRDLAVLRALGFVRAQVVRALAVQAALVCFAALVVAVPLGAIVGRWAWRSFAGFLGVGAAPTVPWLALAVLVPAALAVAALVAATPARAAARTKPVLVLRSE